MALSNNIHQTTCMHSLELLDFPVETSDTDALSYSARLTAERQPELSKEILKQQSVLRKDRHIII